LKSLRPSREKEASPWVFEFFWGALANPRSEKEKATYVFFWFLFFGGPSPTRLAA
jgi:hypothetical protein